MSIEEILKPFAEAEAMLHKYWPCCPDELVERMNEDLAIGCAQDRCLGDPITDKDVRQFRQFWEAKWRKWMLDDPNGVSEPVRNYYRKYLAN